LISVLYGLKLLQYHGLINYLNLKTPTQILKERNLILGSYKKLIQSFKKLEQDFNENLNPKTKVYKIFFRRLNLNENLFENSKIFINDFKKLIEAIKHCYLFFQKFENSLQVKMKGSGSKCKTRKIYRKYKVSLL